MRKGEIDIITLGCSKNLVDAERLMRQLELAGYRCVHDSPQPKGEIAIINTCGFIGDAKEESIEMILQFADRKNKGKLSKLYVMGCLSQRYAKELPAEIPEVDGWFGKFDYLGIIKEVQEFRSLGVQELSEKELSLIQRLVDYPAAVRQAGDEFSPAVIANYAYSLACDFNSFYHDHSILNEADAEKRALRLVLAQTVAKVIKSAMSLLGIEVPNRM